MVITGPPRKRLVSFETRGFESHPLRHKFMFKFFKKNKNPFKNPVFRFARNKKEPKDIKDVLKRLERLEEINEKLTGQLNSSLQKVGLVRFNPFKEIGGNQSFSIAVLDADNNGFVLTSHYGKESNRVYTKPIGNGKSSYSLSSEEEKAVRKAIEGN